MRIADEVKFVKGLAPAADRWNTDPETDRVKLDGFNKAVFLVHQADGTTGKATLTVKAYAAASGGSGDACAFSYRVGADGASTDGDAMGALTQASVSGFTTTPATDRQYLIEIRADQLPEGKPYVSLKCTEAANDPVNAAVEIMLYEGRYIGDELESVID